MKEFFAAIITFFISLFNPTQAPQASPPQPTAIPATPLPTPAYLRQTYTNPIMNYQFAYPASATVSESPDRRTSWIRDYTLSIYSYFTTTFNPEEILAADLACTADSPKISISCQNTAIRPFTNQSGSEGFLIRRTKTIEGAENAGVYQDTAYVFPLNSPASPGIIISVEYPSEENLQILADIANWLIVNP